MDARWMPVLAAVVGVLGGVGGALAGGAVANSGQEQQFQNERRAAIQDLRADRYGEYAAAVGRLVDRYQIVIQTEKEPEAINKLIEPQILELEAATAFVDVLAGSKVRAKADELTAFLIQGGIDDQERYSQLGREFYDLARDEIEAT
jgi:hypothetical protein